MEQVTVDDLDRHLSTASVKRPVGEALGVEGFALHQYELEPYETFSTNVHTHLDQEEIFYVLAGTATFETDEGSVAVAAGEAIRFAPGEYQQGKNDSDSRVVALVMGAPKESEESRIECPACDARKAPKIERTDDGSAIVFECRACGAEINRQD
jgi:uncharacterized cupin superfamily protein